MRLKQERSCGAFINRTDIMNSWKTMVKILHQMSAVTGTQQNRLQGVRGCYSRLSFRYPRVRRQSQSSSPSLRTQPLLKLNRKQMKPKSLFYLFSPKDFWWSAKVLLQLARCSISQHKNASKMGNGRQTDKHRLFLLSVFYCVHKQLPKLITE